MRTKEWTSRKAWRDETGFLKPTEPGTSLNWGLHDPRVDWTRKRRGRGQNEVGPNI